MNLPRLREPGGELDPTRPVLRQIVAAFASPDLDARELPQLAVLRELIERGIEAHEFDARLRAINRAGYLAAGIAVAAEGLLRRPSPALSLRLAEELCDAVDEALGLELARACLQVPAVRASAPSPGGVFARAHLLIADTLERSGDVDAAARHYDAVLAVELDHPRALSGWTRCQARLDALGRPRELSSAARALLSGLEALEYGAQAGLERYEIGRPIGRGRHAVVYEAWDRAVGRSVALKRLLAADRGSTSSHDRLLHRRFFAEARTLAKVRSAYVVALLDARPRHRFVALELCAGGNLRAAIRRQRVGAEDLPRVGAQLELALRAVHAVGAAHRDVKPANILLRHLGAHSPIALADFGVAVEASAAPTAGGAGRGRAGSLRYLAPELRSSSPPPPGSEQGADRFAAGVVLLELALHPAPLPAAFDRIDGLIEGAADPRDLLPTQVRGVWRDKLQRWLAPDPKGRSW